MKKRRVWTLILTGVMVTAALAACSGSGDTSDTSQSSDDSQTASQDVLVIDDDEWYGSDLYQQDSWTSGQSLIADTLFTIDPETGDLLDGICTDLQISDDGLTMTMTLPEGKYYASGEQVEPEDVVASIEWGKEVSPYADGYSNIESMDVDGRTITFHLSEFRSDLLYYLGECFMGVIDKDQLDSMTQDELMWGAQPYGMYSIESYEPGSGVTLTVNEGYKTDNPLVENQGPAAIQTIEVRFNSEEFTSLEELKAGTVDIIMAVSMDGKADLEDEDNVTVSEKTYPNIEYFEMNTTGALEDIAVRQAIALTLDRDALCELTDGAATPAYSMIFDSVSNFSQEAKDDFMENYANDPERAAQILADAGYSDSDGDGYLDKDGQNIEFTYYTRSEGTSVVIAQGMQEQLREAGILMNIESIDWNYIYENINNDDYDAGIEVLEWAEPILVLNACYYDLNAPGNTEEYYEAVSDAASTVDSDERTEKIGQIQMDMFENWNIIPFYSDVNYMAYSNDVQGIEIMSNGTLFWNDISF